MDLMDVAITEWLSVCFRWLHMIAAMAWIGASFYFIHLDLALEPVAATGGREAEAWEVHGGGFYRAVKYLVAPARLPQRFTWFKWEAYATWLSGFVLLIVVYYWNADLFLIDPAVLALTPTQAVLISLGTLAGAWLVYEALCRSPLGTSENLLAAIGFVFLVALCIVFTHVFSGRGVLMQMGAMVGTMMVANVFVVIIPGQKKTVAAMAAGETPNPKWGAQGKQRSVHNNYLTLPVVFLMISNHYPLIFATRYNWAIFAVVLMLGFLIRHFYNLRHAGRPNPWWAWVAAAAGMAAVAWLSLAGTRGAAAAAVKAPVSFAEVQDIVLSRCSMCHAAEPVWAGIPTAPRDVRLDTPDSIRLHAREILLFAVLTNAMPPANITDLSDADRAKLGAGLARLARAQGGAPDR
jgi:uncharacterized membrane protein